ncbi:MAG: hypothetical protein BGN96_06795 [Bacteroidales bacterium 45-6]|uniref:hypothetical protein n=1 Tax=uncultured Dysgonomonas sp. TaxID=206096 RepID=UPI0009638238|nr:hypothetical protein [uncultured Dysgonomonas sp.]OJU45948.1 MAG: hypothetical protein BGN96_06795 [Bacteroidales bacterium 45-6]
MIKQREEYLRSKNIPALIGILKESIENIDFRCTEGEKELKRIPLLTKEMDFILNLIIEKHNKMNDHVIITSGQNITSMEYGDLWLVVENFQNVKNNPFVSLQCFPISAADLRWLESFKIFKIAQIKNYDVGSSSLVVEPLPFCDHTKLIEIYAELINRKYDETQVEG